eukprot:m.241204 g.241204  ORF g.241204 m.241204 type:complete len:78 (+) comp16086_c0_seq23:1502-1735(+)
MYVSGGMDAKFCDFMMTRKWSQFHQQLFALPLQVPRQPHPKIALHFNTNDYMFGLTGTNSLPANSSSTVLLYISTIA